MIYKRLFPGYMEGLVERLYHHDEHTYQHSIRVGTLSQCIALALGYSPKDADEVRIAGFLHDAGKLMIDSRVLQKTESLTDDEWDLMKKHPAYGAVILNEYGIENPLFHDAVLFHHERLDGSGYPYKLPGDTIPFIAQIIGIADSFDAMTQLRPYMAVIRTEHEAIRELMKCKEQYNKEFIDVLVDEYKMHHATIC